MGLLMPYLCAGVDHMVGLLWFSLKYLSQSPDSPSRHSSMIAAAQILVPTLLVISDTVERRTMANRKYLAGITVQAMDSSCF